MQESEFNQRVDDILIEIEDAIEECGVDIDYETVAGILTLTFEDDSKVIINRQTPARQIWVAARSGGYHFDFDDDSQQWIKHSDKQELFAALGQYCTEQAKTPVSLLD